MKILLILIVFFMGLYYVSAYPSHTLMESFTSETVKQNCPNVLIQKGKKLYLYNSNRANIPGVNPIIFNNLEEYVEFLNWQRSQGIRCKVLFLQHSYNTQGESEYKIRPDPLDQQGGLLPEAQAEPDSQKSKLIDAGHNDKPYNVNSYPGFDHDNQYIGLDTPLDKMFHDNKDSSSPNPMDVNWGGQEYTQKMVDDGKYADDEVFMAVTDG
jgi:hypothetical protein